MDNIKKFIKKYDLTLTIAVIGLTFTGVYLWGYIRNDDVVMLTGGLFTFFMTLVVLYLCKEWE